jgi:hypothetical protein
MVRTFAISSTLATKKWLRRFLPPRLFIYCAPFTGWPSSVK